MANDVKFIGLTAHNKLVVDAIMERKWFKYQFGVAKFAMGVAISQGIDPGQIEGAETVWNVGSFDPEGELRDLIYALFPDTEMPYKLVEYFVNVGLRMVETHLTENPQTEPAELIEAFSQRG